ncbi:hypothetical protein B0H11DRAFT_2296485 [Mycena galericulata]|nr:hypothetical protein B0H11DRAFT_2296485 [Mycena galericulata]
MSTTCRNCGEIPFKSSPLIPNSEQITRLRDILHSNTLPPETSNFRSIIAEAPPELARYDVEIQRIQDTLDRLNTERATLESYTNGCRSVRSVLRRFPIELLGEIFDICAPPGAKEISQATTCKEEVERLAKKYLLQISQVCSRWHTVGMGTPKLWSNIVVDETLWIGSSKRPETLLALVEYSLRRSGGHPLRIQVSVGYDSVENAVLLEMLSRHASRWQHLYLWNRLSSLQGIVLAKKKLPLLETLEIQNRGPELGIFKITPRLTTVAFTGPANKIPFLPWKQIRCFSYVGSRGINLADELALIRQLPSRASCELSLNVCHAALPVSLLPIVSNISTLSIKFTVPNDQHQTTRVLGAVLASLTLPRLQALELAGQSGESPLFWHHRHFLSFASRSALQRSLTRLEIGAILEDEELLECLSVLPLLEELVISDFEDEDHILITDDLLRGLVWSPDPTCIIPKLTFLCISSLLWFSDDVFLDFVTSRLVSPRQDRVPFEIKACWLQDSISDEFLQLIEELHAREDFVFTAF